MLVVNREPRLLLQSALLRLVGQAHAERGPARLRTSRPTRPAALTIPAPALPTAPD
jgi:hypothetical protein